MVPIYQVIVLAIIQGLTEFLPVSSSAHLALAPWLFHWKDPGLTFDVALHFGTLVAVLIYFAKDLWEVTLAGFRMKEPTDPVLRAQPNLLWMLAAGTVPIVVAGLLLKSKVETTFRNPYLIGTMLIVVGIVMWWADRRLNSGRDLKTLSWRDSLTIGTAQALAVVPGTSRSGITITAGLLQGLDRYNAARFSFLLSTPAIGGAALLAAKDLYKAGGVAPEMQMPFLVGMVVSGLVGGLVIKGFLDFLRRYRLQGFAIYRVVFGIIVIALAYLSGFQAG